MGPPCYAIVYRKCNIYRPKRTQVEQKQRFPKTAQVLRKMLLQSAICCLQSICWWCYQNNNPAQSCWNETIHYDHSCTSYQYKLSINYQSILWPILRIVFRKKWAFWDIIIPVSSVQLRFRDGICIKLLFTMAASSYITILLDFNSKF